MIKIGIFRIRKLLTPKWEFEFRRYTDGTWHIALGRILIYTLNP